MSEVMTPMSFEQLVDWVLQEKKKEEPCSDSIMRTGQMEHITGRCSGVLWRRRLEPAAGRIRR